MFDRAGHNKGNHIDRMQSLGINFIGVINCPVKTIHTYVSGSLLLAAYANPSPPPLGLRAWAAAQSTLGCRSERTRTSLHKTLTRITLCLATRSFSQVILIFDLYAASSGSINVSITWPWLCALPLRSTTQQKSLRRLRNAKLLWIAMHLAFNVWIEFSDRAWTNS